MPDTPATDAATGSGGGGRARRSRLIAATAIVLVALGLFGILLRVTAPAPSSPSAPTTSTDPQAFDLPRLDGGGHVRLSDFRGKPLVVNFFASWCDPCKQELPGFSAVSKRLQGRVAFLGVNAQETGDGLTMARTYGIGSWPLARDVDGQNASGLHDSLGAVGMPTTAFYDRTGKLLFVHPGQISQVDLLSKIQELYGVAG